MVVQVVPFVEANQSPLFTLDWSDLSHKYVGIHSAYQPKPPLSVGFRELLNLLVKHRLRRHS